MLIKLPHGYESHLRKAKSDDNERFQEWVKYTMPKRIKEGAVAAVQDEGRAPAFSGVPTIAFWLHKMASIFPDQYLSNLDRQIWLEAVSVGSGATTLQKLAVFLAR